LIGYILLVLYVVSCLILILFVLLQPGKSDAAAVFGGGVNSAAFGPRGTQTVLAKVTIGAAILFFLIAFLFSIPGLFEKKSLGESAGPAEASQPVAPAPSAPAPVSIPPASTPTAGQAAGAAPATSSNPSEAGNKNPSAPADSKSQDKSGAKKP
jgi:preprotein translocase subunit SecG